MLGFKRFANATVTITGIELMHRLRKDQFDLGEPSLKDAPTSDVWNVVLSAH